MYKANVVLHDFYSFTEKISVYFYRRWEPVRKEWLKKEMNIFMKANNVREF